MSDRKPSVKMMDRAASACRNAQKQLGAQGDWFSWVPAHLAAEAGRIEALEAELARIHAVMAEVDAEVDPLDEELADAHAIEASLREENARLGEVINGWVDKLHAAADDHAYTLGKLAAERALADQLAEALLLTPEERQAALAAYRAARSEVEQ